MALLCIDIFCFSPTSVAVSGLTLHTPQPDLQLQKHFALPTRPLHGPRHAGGPLALLCFALQTLPGPPLRHPC
eukprot:5542595-Lingulodinium_polyedra.AAC.1